MISWPADLVADIAARRCVIFLGAGVSKNAATATGERPKDWVELLSSMASSIGDEEQRGEVERCIQEWDLLTACELVKKFLHPDGLKTALLHEFTGKRFEPAAIHDDLSRIDSRFVLTTNFDKLYENRANQLQHNTVLVKHYYDDDVADVFRRTQRAVLKVHGTVDSLGRVIMSRSDYAWARQKYAYFYHLLRSLFVTHTHVFIGASLRDPDIQLVLEDHAYRFSGSRPHYIVMPHDAARRGTLTVMEETMNLRALLYDPSGGHAELGQSIRALVPLVEAGREELKLTTDW